MKDVVEIAAARFWPWLFWMTLTTAVCAANLVRVLPSGFALIVCCLIGVLWAHGVVFRARLSRVPFVLRLDGTGITPYGMRTIGWDEVRAVRWIARNAAFAVEPQQTAAVLPQLALLQGGPQKQARRLQAYGTSLVVNTKILGTPPKDIAAAVRRFGGGVPVLYL